MTRAELLSQFGNYDNAVLEKLHVIAGSILNPNIGQLVNVDFASMVNEVFKVGGYADTYYPEWTDRGKSDFGRFLVEIFAVFSDKDFFYINHFAKEAFGSTAERYRSLVHKAISNGYTPTKRLASDCVVDLVFAAGAEETISRGAIQLGKAGVSGVSFVNNEEFVIPASANPTQVSVHFYYGAIKSSHGVFNGRSIMVDEENVCSNTLRLYINGILYDLTETFSEGNVSMKHYMALYNDKSKAELIFAKGGYGYVPSFGDSYQVDYVVGGGLAGNFVAGTLDNVLACHSQRSLQSFYQNTAVVGAEQPTKEQLRIQVMQYERHLGRAVTPEDFVNIALQLSFVKKAKAVYIGNYCFLYCVPVGGGDLTPTQVDDIQLYFENKRSSRDALSVTAPAYVPITLHIDIYLLPSVSIANAQYSAEQAVKEYLDPLESGEIGRTINRAALTASLMTRVFGAQNVDYNQMNRGVNVLPVPAPADIVLVESEAIDYDNSDIAISFIGGM